MNEVLFYREAGKLMAADIETDPAFTHAKPRTVMEIAPYFVRDSVRANYDIAPDGRRYVMVKSLEQPGEQIRVVVNWFEELKRLVPTES